MLRDLQYPAIVLRVHSWEKHKFVTLLTPEGLIEAKQFGASSGKSLGVEIKPFLEGTFFLYRKGTYVSIKGVDQCIEHDELRTDLSLVYTATFFCELIYRSHGLGGEAEAARELLHTSLALLATKPRELVVIYMIKEVLEILGQGINVSECASCGRDLRRAGMGAPRTTGDSSSRNSTSAAQPGTELYLNYDMPAFVCCTSRSANASGSTNASGRVCIPAQGTAFLQSFLPGMPRVELAGLDRTQTKEALLSLVQLLWDDRLRSLQGGFV